MQGRPSRSAASLPRKFVRTPLVRVVLAFIFLALALLVAQVIVVAPLRSALGAGDGSPWELLFRGLHAVAALLGYWAYVRLVERRPASELSLLGAGSELGRGALLGAGLAAAMVGTLWLLGHYRPADAGDWAALPALLGYSLIPAVAEEVFFRGAVFRISEESLGTWFALPFSALLFGLYHSANPGADVFSTVVVMLTGGVLLAAAFVLTRRLWLAIGVHVAWNFTQPGVFGVVTDGRDYEGIFQGRLVGPGLLTGGSYGPQASVLALAVCLVASAWLLAQAVRKGRWVPTPWGRRAALYGGIAMLVAGLLSASSWQLPAIGASCGITFAVTCVVMGKRGGHKSRSERRVMTPERGRRTPR